MTLQSLGLDAVFKGEEAEIRNFRVQFDPDNYVDLAASTRMTDPFPFQAKGGVVFKKVAVLNEFLKNLGMEADAGGAINVNFAGSGDVHNPSGKLQVSGTQLQYHGVVVQDLDIRAIAEKNKAEIQSCRVTLDPHNRVELQGTAELADPYPYAINGTIALTDLAVFDGLIKSLGQPPGLTGALNGSFSITGDAQHPGAQLQLSGDQFAYRGLVIPTIQIKAAVEDAKAELQTCRFVVNPNDFIDVTGSVGITSPFGYRAQGQVALRDLGAFNELLKKAGQPGDLRGSLNVDFSGKGDSKIQPESCVFRVTGSGIVDYPIKNWRSKPSLKTGWPR